MMKKLALLLIALAAACTSSPPQADRRTVTLLHFSDYHSHAVPFYSEGETQTAGIARAIGYLERFAGRDDVLVFSGGDMINRGSPSWSDKYRCAEWSWFNGIVDAMAFGNHDADYGPEVFAACREDITFPILSANLLGEDSRALLRHEGRPYAVFERNGIRVGVFAIAGADFQQLVGPGNSPARVISFADPAVTAREVVRALREEENVDAVVMIGHQQHEEDLALARAVPGIDVIFGTHSHRRSGLEKIDGTGTWTISPFQYLTYISRVELHFECETTGCALVDAAGGLVPMSPSVPRNEEIARRVASMQQELERDPSYRDFFRPIGTVRRGLSTEGQLHANSPLGSLVMEVMRSAAGAHAAFSTSSSFREPIAPGVILEETLRASLPYPNQILLFRLRGDDVEQLVRLSVSRAGSDLFSQTAGIRYGIENGSVSAIEIFRDPAEPDAGFEPLDPSREYLIATTDYQARIAPGYRDFFSTFEAQETGKEVRAEVRAWFMRN